MSDTRQKGTESPKAKGEKSGVTWSKETPKRMTKLQPVGPRLQLKMKNEGRSSDLPLVVGSTL